MLFLHIYIYIYGGMGWLDGVCVQVCRVEWREKAVVALEKDWCIPWIRLVSSIP